MGYWRGKKKKEKKKKKKACNVGCCECQGRVADGGAVCDVLCVVCVLCLGASVLLCVVRCVMGGCRRVNEKGRERQGATSQ